MTTREKLKAIKHGEYANSQVKEQAQFFLAMMNTKQRLDYIQSAQSFADHYTFLYHKINQKKNKRHD